MVYINFLNEKALSKDKDRIVSWNWCSLNDGVNYEDLLEEHSKRASLLEENSRGLIAWANVYPRIGMSEAPGDFAHLALFPLLHRLLLVSCQSSADLF